MSKRSRVSNGEGKSDLMRSVDWKKYEYNYERIFNPKCSKCGHRKARVAPHIRRFYCPLCEGEYD